MKRLLPVLMGFLFLLLPSTEGWSLPPCPEKGIWNNCFGTYKSDDGTKYVGEWKEDQSHGQGTETYPSGHWFKLPDRLQGTKNLRTWQVLCWTSSLTVKTICC